MERFDIFNARRQEQEAKAEPTATKPPSKSPTTNGYHAQSSKSPTPEKSPVKREVPSDAASDVTNPSPPKKQKQKQRPADEDADAAFAAKLQAEEDKRARPTRGGNSRKAAPP